MAGAESDCRKLVRVAERLETMLVRAALLVLAGYRYLISPLLPRACRFVPTCSEYAVEALRTHGLVRGSVLAARRLARCHPLGDSGLDPVPGGKAGVSIQTRQR